MVACKTGATAGSRRFPPLVAAVGRTACMGNGAGLPRPVKDRASTRICRPFLPCTTMVSVGKLDTVVQQGASELLRRLTTSAMPAARHDGAPIRRTIHGAV
jgi:hypothetical protein